MHTRLSTYDVVLHQSKNPPNVVHLNDSTLPCNDLCPHHLGYLCILICIRVAAKIRCLSTIIGSVA